MVIYRGHLEYQTLQIRYALSLLLMNDDYTRVSWEFLLKNKSNATIRFKNFHSMIQNLFHTNLQILHTYNGTEYFNSILGEYLLCHDDIMKRNSCKHTATKTKLLNAKIHNYRKLLELDVFNFSPETFLGRGYPHCCLSCQ